MAKVDEGVVRYIRSTRVSSRLLARELGLSPREVTDIRSRRTYINVPGPEQIDIFERPTREIVPAEPQRRNRTAAS